MVEDGNPSGSSRNIMALSVELVNVSPRWVRHTQSELFLLFNSVSSCADAPCSSSQVRRHDAVQSDVFLLPSWAKVMLRGDVLCPRLRGGRSQLRFVFLVLCTLEKTITVLDVHPRVVSTHCRRPSMHTRKALTPDLEGVIQHAFSDPGSSGWHHLFGAACQSECFLSGVAGRTPAVNACSRDCVSTQRVREWQLLQSAGLPSAPVS